MRTHILSVGCAALAVVCLASIARAQTSWWRTYGGASEDRGYWVQQTSDGGYIIAGYTSSYGAGNGDVYLIKTNALGNTLWTRTYGGTDVDFGISVEPSSDGGYIIAGFTGSFGPGTSASENVYLVKTDVSGDTQWTRTYGGTRTDHGLSVQQTSDGGYVIAGATVSFGAGGADVYLIKANTSGDTLWTRTYGGTDEETGYSVEQSSDGGYIVAGWTKSFGAGNGDVFLIKTNASGDSLWTRTYGGTDVDVGDAVQLTADGGYIIAGATKGTGGYNVYLVKTDASGDTLWTRTYGGTDHDVGYSVQQTSDGGYIIAGLTGSFGAGDVDVYLIKTNASGDSQWTRTYGGTSSDYGYSVQQTADDGYIVAGWTKSFGAEHGDVYLIKTDSLGNVGVAEESPKPQAMRGRPGTTVMSGASGVRQLASCVAFDAMGRRVLHPKPGIYFLRTATTDRPRKILLVE
jgi:hypothetical protein